MLSDLEAVRFRTFLTDAERIEDLAQLNASIADALASADDRRAAFDRYAEALPFRASAGEVIQRITALSLARGHLFRAS